MPDGIKGIGPKTALKMVTQYGSLQDLLAHLGDKSVFPVDPEELIRLFLEPDVTESYELSWASPDVDGIFVTGGCFRILESLDALEKDMGKPVVMTTAANMWRCLQLVGVKDPICGFGQLLEKPR